MATDYTSSSTYMNMPIPVVGQSPGPNYAQDINNCLTKVDSHDHSAGNGNLVTPAGLNITSQLQFNNNLVLNASGLNLATQSSVPSLVSTVYAATSSGNTELWYKDGSGTAVQLTKAGVVNSTASSIPGEAYSGGAFIWTQTQSSLPTTPASFSMGALTLQPISAGTTYSHKIQVNPSLSGNLTLTLPAANPSANSFMALDNSGNITAGPLISGGITSSNIGSGAVLGSNIAANTITYSNLS